MRHFLILVLAVYSGLALTQDAPGELPRQPIKRDVWMVLIRSSLVASCDTPSASPGCMAKTPEICRKHLPAAFDQCEKSFKTRMPEEIQPSSTRHWSNLLGRCMVDNFILLAGSSGIDMAKCPRRAP